MIIVPSTNSTILSKVCKLANIMKRNSYSIKYIKFIAITCNHLQSLEKPHILRGSSEINLIRTNKLAKHFYWFSGFSNFHFLTKLKITKAIVQKFVWQQFEKKNESWLNSLSLRANRHGIRFFLKTLSKVSKVAYNMAIFLYTD